MHKSRCKLYILIFHKAQLMISIVLCEEAFIHHTSTCSELQLDYPSFALKLPSSDSSHH